MQLHHRLVSILRRVRQDVATLLDTEAINAACCEENYSCQSSGDTILNFSEIGMLSPGLHRSARQNCAMSSS